LKIFIEIFGKKVKIHQIFHWDFVECKARKKQKKFQIARF